MPSHRAYVLHSFDEPVGLESVETPEPAPGQVLVEVIAAPILSYAAAVLSGQLGFPMVFPLTPGPSATARVLSAGEDATSLSEGQLVYCIPIIRARDDHTGLTSILQGWNAGASSDSRKLMEGSWRGGSWAEKMIVPLENVVPLDEERLNKSLGYSLPQLVWINDLLVGYGPLEAAGLTPGATVIVAPASGHFGGTTVRLALALGAGTVIAASRSKAKLQGLKEFDETGRLKLFEFSGDVGTDSKALKALTPRASGADIYVDFSPFSAGGSTHPQACISALKTGGTAILSGGISDNISLSYAQLVFSNITVRGNFMYSKDAPSKIVALLEAGIVKLHGINVTKFGLDDIQEGIKWAEKNETFSNLTVFALKE